MKVKNLSVKRLFGRVAMGLVLSMSGITIALFLVTKQIAVLLTGGALLLCALVGIFVLTQAFGKRLSQFTTDLCQTLDHMIAGNEAPKRPEDSETQLARIGHRLARVIERDLQENYHPEQIRLLVDGCWQTVDARNVLYAEATSHKSAVHLQGGEVLYINQNFSDLLPRLNGKRFCRVHFSILVNLEHVYRLADSALTLDDGRELPVSRSRKKEVKKQYIAFIK